MDSGPSALRPAALSLSDPSPSGSSPSGRTLSDPTLPCLTLSGTYTLDPVADVVEFWNGFLQLGLRIRNAPYAQMFQQLLDPSSALRGNQAGANVVLLRWNDLLAQASSAPAQPLPWVEIEQRVAEVASAVRSFDHRVPCLVLVGPSDPLLARATVQMQSLLAGVANVSVEGGEAAIERYAVGQVDDPAADRFGHVPFTPAAMAALGTTIARWYAALQRPPVKVIAVDADHTLWSGVVAEDGPEGVRVDAPHRKLQQALLQQGESGRLLCLLSKNEAADVRAAFDSHPEMPLRWPHLVAHRVDWQAKPDNLRDMVAGLKLGLDGVLFLDDNPVECAQMRAECPAVSTVRVPTAPHQLASFTDHLWLFDGAPATAEDQARSRMYREEASRAELRRGTTSLQAFLDSLELVVDVAPPSPSETVRLAQLSQRTNQFNASLIRCDERAIASTSEEDGMFHRVVRARDRFGDYGIVGQVRARRHGDKLAVDLFMLSCRALGRGIEFQMLAAAGAHAQSQGMREVAVLFRRGDRNAPARGFLERVFDVSAAGDEHWFCMPVALAAGARFDPANGQADSGGEGDVQRTAAGADASPSERALRYEHIAHALTSGESIVRAMAGRIRARPDLASGFVAPAPGLEREIAGIWQDVLHIDQIGSHDRFQDLGGKSIHLVEVHSLLRDRLNVEPDITTLFQHPTVASLAMHLGARAQGGVVEAARQRGLMMRDARARAARRPGVSA